jgi:hypothetical protein
MAKEKKTVAIEADAATLTKLGRASASLAEVASAAHTATSFECRSAKTRRR